VQLWPARSWRLATPFVALALLACAGCTNAPGALELRVVPEKDTFRAREPIRLSATLTAVGGNVCYGRDSQWAVTLEPAGAGPPIRNQRDWVCGTGLMPFIIPLYVCAVPVQALDVGDGLGRFDVLPRGNQQTWRLVLIPEDVSGGRMWLEAAKDREPTLQEWQVAAPLPAGGYLVRVQFLSEYDWPPPLFWAPYEHPLVATREIAVVDGPATTAGQ